MSSGSATQIFAFMNVENLKNKNDPILSSPGFEDTAHAGTQWQDRMEWNVECGVQALGPSLACSSAGNCSWSKGNVCPSMVLSEVHKAPSLHTLCRVKQSGAVYASLDLSSGQCAMGQPQIDGSPWGWQKDKSLLPTLTSLPCLCWDLGMGCEHL